MSESETSAFDPTATQPLPPAIEYPFRLLADETVLGSYPITQKRRPLGKLASFLFITDSRVIYSAEAKTIVSSSIHSREYQVADIKGIEVDRHTGLDALGVTALIGVVFNFLGMVILAVALGVRSSSASSYSFGFDPFAGLAGLGGVFGFLAFASLVVGVVVFFVLRRPGATLQIVTPSKARPLARQSDIPKLLITILLFLIFGLSLGLVVIVWNVVRELGLFSAGDAQLFVEPNNVDRIAREAGALIIDVQTRGKLAGTL